MNWRDWGFWGVVTGVLALVLTLGSVAVQYGRDREQIASLQKQIEQLSADMRVSDTQQSVQFPAAPAPTQIKLRILGATATNLMGTRGGEQRNFFAVKIEFANESTETQVLSESFVRFEEGGSWRKLAAFPARSRVLLLPRQTVEVDYLAPVPFAKGLRFQLRFVVENGAGLQSELTISGNTEP